MRLVYLDEAGISKNERMLTVGAVIVHGDNQLTATERHLDRLVEKWIPVEHRVDFVFHANRLFHGGGVFRRDTWSRAQRLELAKELAAVPVQRGLKLALGCVDKDAQPSDAELAAKQGLATEAELAIFFHAAAFSGCVLAVDHWMRKNTPNEICMLISEDNEQARKTILKVIRAQQSPTAAASFPQHKGMFPLRKVKEDPVFQPKRSSSVLQLADLWAYVAKRALMGDEDCKMLWRIMKPSLVPGAFVYESAA